jgi:hypothetical protein
MLRLWYAWLILLKRFQHLPHYFDSHLKTRSNHILRNDGGGELLLSGNLSIFGHPRWPLLKNVLRGRYLINIKFRQTHNYILFTCDELISFV